MTGVIDSDYEGEIMVVAQTWVPWTFKGGDRIAPLLLLPCVQIGQSQQIRQGGFSSTNPLMVKWASLLTQTDRPSMTLKIRGRTFSGLVDSGANISVIASQHWPNTWPTQVTSSLVEGMGFVTAEEIRQSSVSLKCDGPNGLEGVIQSFILNTINLWGRDLLQQCGAELIIPPNQPVNQIMTKMGYEPGQGLGRQRQGIKEPIIAQGQTYRAGLGYPFF